MGIIFFSMIGMSMFSDTSIYCNKFMFLFCILIFFASIASFIFFNPITETEVVRVPIYSLEDNLSNSGSFILGSGYVNQNLFYYYFIKDDTNKMSLIRAYAANIKILEIDGNIAYEVYIVNTRRITKRIFARNPYFRLSSRTDCNYIEVPKGTVMKKYNIDLK
jgi:hypothetical protein